jgi:GTP pyrophosphokinase
MSTSISDIVERIATYSPDADVSAVMQAYLIAANAHQGQYRNSGEPYLSHPLEVARILADMRMDVDTIATALLHDALEDSPITKAEMTAQVGPVIAELVDGVTKIGKLKFRSKEELHAENFRKMMMAMSRDLRVILVKLADRLHNMRTLDGHKPEKQEKIARETLEVYAPIANRLGLISIKAELEDICLRVLDPDAHAGIVTFLESTSEDRNAYIARVVKELAADLASRGIMGTVSGRAKATYSIYSKMKSNGLDANAVQDLLAFRLIVPDEVACYTMLGFVHSKYPPVPGRIKDYIARPKTNGYRSLHTTVVGPENKRVEIQIRTAEMHRIAEEGIAAHWRYKEGHLALAPSDVVEIARIREAFEGAHDSGDASDFMESVKVSFYADEVFVFTPTGEVKKFPLGATPLDFAYAVHSDVGAHCTGAKVNGKMVPLDYRMQSGDALEILTHPSQRPRRDWLEIAHTARAIQKIRRFLHQEEEQSALRMGKEILEAELQRVGWTWEKASATDEYEAYLKRRGIKNVESLFGELAHGHQSPGDVARGILPEAVWYSKNEESRRNRITGLLQRFVRKSRSPVLITGEDGLLVSYAGCCNPLPGEDVVGFITRGRGITVHRSDCEQLLKLEEDRRVPVEWDLTSSTRHSHSLSISCEDRPGILAAITKVCEVLKVNIERAEARSGPGSGGTVILQVAVKDLSELTKVIRNLEKIPEVTHVSRGTR